MADGPRGVIGMNPDFVALGRAYGANAERVESAVALGSALTRALAARGPTLIEVRLPG